MLGSTRIGLALLPTASTGERHVAVRQRWVYDGCWQHQGNALLALETIRREPSTSVVLAALRLLACLENLGVFLPYPSLP